MAKHSKWANIRHRKGVQDARRGKIFTKIIREITVATRAGGGGDPKLNPRLRTAIDKALDQNMTRGHDPAGDSARHRRTRGGAI